MYSDRPDERRSAAHATTSDLVKRRRGRLLLHGRACGAFDASLGALNLTSLTKGCVDTDSIAVYFDTTWALTDRFNLNAGARWNEDDKEATVFVAQYLGRLRRERDAVRSEQCAARLHAACRAEQLHEQPQFLECVAAPRRGLQARRTT